MCCREGIRCNAVVIRTRSVRYGIHILGTEQGAPLLGLAYHPSERHLSQRTAFFWISTSNVSVSADKPDFLEVQRHSCSAVERVAPVFLIAFPQLGLKHRPTLINGKSM